MHRFFRWRERLWGANNETAVRDLVAEYLLSLDAEAVRQLPASCQESLAAGHIQDCAVSLLQAEMAFNGPEEARQLLHEVAHTFAAASVRLSKLRMEPIVPGGA